MNTICPICLDPTLDGQPMNGQTGQHWACQPKELQDNPLATFFDNSEDDGEKKVKPATKAQLQRYAWIKNWIKTRTSGSNCVQPVDRAFVEAYIEAHQAKSSIVHSLAPTCPQLTRDLNHMHRLGHFSRKATTTYQHANADYPKWIYTYQLTGKAQ